VRPAHQRQQVGGEVFGKIRAAAGVVFLHDVPVVGKVHVAGKGQRHTAVLCRFDAVPVGGQRRGQRRGGRRGRRRRGGGHCGRGGGHRRRAAARCRGAACQQQRRAQCRRQGGFSLPHGATSFPCWCCLHHTTAAAAMQAG